MRYEHGAGPTWWYFVVHARWADRCRTECIVCRSAGTADDTLLVADKAKNEATQRTLEDARTDPGQPQGPRVEDESAQAEEGKDGVESSEAAIGQKNGDTTHNLEELSRKEAKETDGLEQGLIKQVTGCTCCTTCVPQGLNIMKFVEG